MFATKAHRYGKTQSPICMEPNTKHNTGNLQPDPAALSLNEYFGHHTLNEKEALKYHTADTPEGLSRALNEQMGGGNAPVRPGPDEG